VALAALVDEVAGDRGVALADRLAVAGRTACLGPRVRAPRLLALRHQHVTSRFAIGKRDGTQRLIAAESLGDQRRALDRILECRIEGRASQAVPAMALGQQRGG
jgi:hypothetical protein